MTAALRGRSVLVTRERPGELGRMLEQRGAAVVHVPLIAVTDPADGGAALATELERLDRYDWLIVTSAPGAERVGVAARSTDVLRTAAVGTATARVLAELSGRAVDVVPTVQLARALAAEFVSAAPPAQRVLIAQADRADDGLADALRRSGHDVTTVVAYRTVDLEPDPAVVPAADAVLFASGSAVESWVRAFGTTTPPVAVAIGPSTAATARELGLKLTGVAADHSLDGLVTELERQLVVSPAAGRAVGSRDQFDG